MSDYDNYVRAEWQQFASDAKRADALLQATAKIAVKRVLDVGCGAGQEMLPFVEQRGAFGCGVDLAPEAGKIGNELYAAKNLTNRISFLRGSGENLPFAAGFFDVVICRVALVYMDCRRALTEMGRVLRSGGALLLKVHAPQYYWRKFGDGIKTANLLSAIHAARVLVAGNYFSISNRQSFGRLTAGGETFLTKNILEREFKNLGMKLVGELPDTNLSAPSYLIEKQ